MKHYLSNLWTNIYGKNEKFTGLKNLVFGHYLYQFNSKKIMTDQLLQLFIKYLTLTTCRFSPVSFCIPRNNLNGVYWTGDKNFFGRGFNSKLGHFTIKLSKFYVMGTAISRVEKLGPGCRNSLRFPMTWGQSHKTCIEINLVTLFVS
jgi:hypothetical protein